MLQKTSLEFRIRNLVRFFIILFVLSVALIGFDAIRFLRTPPDREDTEVSFLLRKGTVNGVARDLYKKGLVTSERRFAWLVRMTGNAKKIRVGEYRLSTSMEPMDVIEVITSGKSIDYPITFKEGINIYEIGEVLEKAGLVSAEQFMKAATNQKLILELLKEPYSSFEGYLFPETYQFTKLMTVEDMIRTMVAKFLQVYSEVVLSVPKPLVSRHEVVTLASIVEKETGASEERPKVASVFFNRLNIKMQLQTDPTVMYGIFDLTKKPVTNIRREDLKTPTRYNTYTLPRLPHGPISNPGRLALQAVYQPAQSEYLYFVSQNDGTHVFSKTYKDHSNSVKKFQLDRKAREGKSWRDLSKKKN